MRALILGGSGMIGHKLCSIMSSMMDVWATFRGKQKELHHNMEDLEEL